MLVESCEHFWSPKYPWAQQWEHCTGWMIELVMLIVEVISLCKMVGPSKPNKPNFWADLISGNGACQFDHWSMKHFKDRYPIYDIAFVSDKPDKLSSFSGEDEGASGRVPRHQGGRGDQTFLVDLLEMIKWKFVNCPWLCLTCFPQTNPTFISLFIY